MKIEERTSTRGHPYRVLHGRAMSVSVFQGTNEATGEPGKVKVRWPFPGSSQNVRVFGQMESAMDFATRKAEEG